MQLKHRSSQSRRPGCETQLWPKPVVHSRLGDGELGVVLGGVTTGGGRAGPIISNGFLTPVVS